MDFERFLAKADEWAELAREVSEGVRDITDVPGETWVVADLLATDLEEFAWDLRTGAAE